MGRVEKLMRSAGADTRDDLLSIFLGDLFVVASKEQEKRTTVLGHIVLRVVTKGVEASLLTTPKHQQLGEGKGRQVHLMKAIASRIQESIERRFDDHCVEATGTASVQSSVAKYGRRSHRAAEQKDARRPQKPMHIGNGSFHVQRFMPAETRVVP